MALDGLVIAALVHEFNDLKSYNRIEKVFQPEADEIIIYIRGRGKNLKLLLSASSNYPRAHFTNQDKENPATPPNFCMLLRKHLQGGRIVDMQQPEFERIIKFRIESLDELNLIKSRELIIEIMGRHSNIILVDSENNIIIDSIKRVPLDISRYRQILPGLKYTMPPSSKKISPFICTNFESFANQLSDFSQITIIKSLYGAFNGISPLIARELVHLSNLDEEILVNNISNIDLKNLFLSFSSIVKKIISHKYTPSIYIDNTSGAYIDFSVVDLQHLCFLNKKNFPSVSGMLEEFYNTKDQRERIKQKSYHLRKTVNTKLERLYKKLQNLDRDFKKARKSSDYKIKGDLLTANLYHMQNNQEIVELINYYDDDQATMQIKLDKRLSPSQNAQNYYKKYNKSKIALIEIQKQLEKTRNEIKYLEQTALNIDQSTYLSDLFEIHIELMETGYLKKPIVKKNIASHKKTGYLKYRSSDGLDILVGKNNKQNDEITFKIASKEDLWFHIKDMPGSHVILRIKSKDYTDNTIHEAAKLAAYYSKAGNTPGISVDYTRKKNVRKPKGAKPGMVIYSDHSTIRVEKNTNSIDDIQQLD